MNPTPLQLALFFAGLIAPKDGIHMSPAAYIRSGGPFIHTLRLRPVRQPRAQRRAQ